MTIVYSAFLYGVAVARCLSEQLTYDIKNKYIHPIAYSQYLILN